MAILKPEQLSPGPYNISGSFSGSFTGDGSRLINLPNQSFDTGSFVTTSSFNNFTASYNSGSFTGSFVGVLVGTASNATTASYIQNAQTASYVLNAVSASFAPSTPAFPFTGSALITGSLGVTGSIIASSVVSSFTGSITGSISGTISSLIKGEATVDFGSTPGGNYATTTVLTPYVTNDSNIHIYIMSTASADHNNIEHQIFSMYSTVMPDHIINNTSFDIVAVSQLRLNGIFKIRYTINNN